MTGAARDPETFGAADAPARVAPLMTRCITVTGERNLCDHTLAEHHLTDPSAEWPRGHRTYCTVHEGSAGRCPCNLYT